MAINIMKIKKKQIKKNNKNRKINPDNLSKFQGNNKVKVFKKFLHMGLCDLRRERTKNWHKVCISGNTQIEQFGAESLNMYDKSIFLGVIKLAQDKKNESSIKKIVQTKDDYGKEKIISDFKDKSEELLIQRKGKTDIIREEEEYTNKIHIFYTFCVKFNEFCNKYTRVSRQRRNNVLKSIERLWATRTLHKEFSSTGKIIEETPFYYIVDFRLSKGVITFTLSNMLIESCNKGLIISYDFFLSLKTEIAKALYLFFSGTKNNTFAYKTLKNSLGLDDEDFKNRELIKTGLKSLKESKFLKDFKIENRESDTFYILIYDILNNDNKINNLIDITPQEPAILADKKDGVTDGDKTVTDGDKTVTDGDKTVTDGDKTVTDGERGYQINE